MEHQELRDIVETVIEQRWSQWAAEHPHLAEAIDRTRLVSAAVDRLRDDPEYITAMARSHSDQSRLAAAAKLIRLAESVINRLLLI